MAGRTPKWLQDPRLERDACGVGFVAQVRRRNRNRLTRPLHVAADAHAAADVEQHREADRGIAGVELSNGASEPGIDDLEICLLQVADDTSPLVTDGDVDDNSVDPSFEHG